MNALREKSLAATPNIYLTLMSIIQGLALTYFGDKFSLELNVPVLQFVIRALMYGVAIQMIVVTWHEYAVSTICVSWTLGFPDTWLPILLGVSECSVIKNSEVGSVRAFWLSLTFYVVFGFLAFLNRERHFRDTAENQESALLLMEELRRTKRWIAAALIGYALATLIVFWHSEQTGTILLLLILANLSFLFQAVRCHQTYRPVFSNSRNRDATAEASVHL